MLPDPSIPSRRSERYEIVLPMRLSVVPAHAGQVRWWPGQGESDGWIHADMLDIGRQGTGFVATRYLPRRCRLRVRVYGLRAEALPPLLDGTLRIERALMTDSRPGYLYGASFVGGDPVFAHDLEQLLGRLAGDDTDQRGETA